jgi:enoyl-CoA hydratase/carnithine racemase
MSVDEELVRDNEGPVLVLRLNRPESRNALNRTLMEAIGRSLAQAEEDPARRAVVLTGTGPKAFCAGMDLRSFAEGEDLVPGDTAAAEAFQRLLQGTSKIPIVGAANATAVAGGLELLLGCDLIVASSDARFGLPEVQRGLFPAGNGTSLGSRIPLAIALELLLTGESIDAQRAYEVGLVNRVVPPDEVLASALVYARRIAENGPLGVAAAKELARRDPAHPVPADQRLLAWQGRVFASQDAREGAAAYLERRPPVWRGC